MSFLIAVSGIFAGVFAASADARARIYERETRAFKWTNGNLDVKVYTRGAIKVSISRGGVRHSAQRQRTQGGLQKWSTDFENSKVTSGDIITLKVVALSKRGRNDVSKIRVRVEAGIP